MPGFQKKVFFGVGLLLSITVIVGIFLPFYENYQLQQYPKVNLTSKDQNPSEFQEITSQDTKEFNKERDNDSHLLRVGLGAITAGRESLYYYKELLDHLEDQLGMEVKIHQTRTHSEMNELIRHGNIDIAFICSYSYIQLQDSHGVPLLVVPEINGTTTYRSVILARKELNIDAFNQLENKTFAFTDPLSNAGKLYPAYLLKQQGQSPQDFFEHSYFTYSHNNSVDSVIEGVVDAAAVDSLVYDYLYTKDPARFENVEIIHTSPAFEISPVVASPKLKTSLKEDIKNFFLELHETSNGQYILEQLGIEQFEPAQDSSYDSIRDMAEVVGYDK
ncbi:phosphate/phosphite/phosphonate ABC transporter substrate-binding protein [Natranaerobius thermophilus]|uniref:Phosphonate ABC transporter, periplasmic phosphonate-binding protein n=1 Tax=Natranaerobius thermophilus (strain ATCC BAA-1301 / DSM 18059 / JW/NM-WN-LF) TaxID=457570 RepID=B2A6W4_NATTJ|nr:phosphate/phosphite/phosphonate ABC transporter substrate-binding protein [Natranaerobius thermophilus]ACB84245.1 phosphonate ABC transporter, periplasmic phosphonate-binding protein [Natranaerobius thermophilus JW/NM-WN-LF]